MTVDDGATKDALDAWVSRAKAAGIAANMEVAMEIRDVAKEIVHKRSGALAASIEASADGDDALVGPTGSAASKNGPYGRFIEMGGPRTAHNDSGYMWWPTGVWTNHAHHQEMGPLPYLKPAADLVAKGGGAARIYYKHWLAAQQG